MHKMPTPAYKYTIASACETITFSMRNGISAPQIDDLCFTVCSTYAMQIVSPR